MNVDAPSVAAAANPEEALRNDAALAEARGAERAGALLSGADRELWLPAPGLDKAASTPPSKPGLGEVALD